jgi:hypothetical protein
MNLLDWYIYHQREITWWVIGWLSFAVLDNILQENYVWACINAGLILLNYKFYKERY